MMKLIQRMCFFGLFTLLISACTTELPLPGASADQKIVLIGELTAGDSVTIRAGQSIPLSAGGSGTQIIQGLTLSLQEEGGSGSALLGREDHLSYQLLTIPFSSPQVVRDGAKYVLSGRHPTLGAVSAEVQIPGPFSVRVAEMAFDDYNGDTVLRFDLDISDPSAAGRHYIIEAVREAVEVHQYFLHNGNQYYTRDYRYLFDSLKSAGYPITERHDTVFTGMYRRQPLYTSDVASENLTGNSPGRLFKRILLPGSAFAGAHHKTQILIPRREIYGESGQHARTTIYVKSVAPSYYSFLKSYEMYDPTMGIGGNAPQPRLDGNVTGGFGMVGGVNRWSVGVFY